MGKKLIPLKHITIVIGILLGGFWGSVVAAPTPTQGSDKIICEDGEVFILEEQRTKETVEIPLITNEYIVIDTKTLRLKFFRDDREVKNYPVAIGEPETPSPVGEWKIINKGGNWGDGFGARWIGINVPWGIYGIHGTNKPYTIGTRASHGCIRMLNQHVLELYGMVKVGTPVYITGTPRDVPLRREMGRKSSGEDVLLVQYALRKAGIDPGRADARYDEVTEQAVLKMQYYYGLAPTGKMTYNEQYLLFLR